MRIGLVTGAYPPGIKQGGPRSAQLLVEMLRERGHEVEVLSFMEGHPEDPEYVTREELPSERSDLLQLLTYRRIKEFANDKDVIHSYNRVFDPAVGMLRDTTTVSTLNNFMFDYPREVTGKKANPKFPPYRAFYNTLARIAIRRIDEFVALAPHIKKHYSKTIPKQNIQVIPNMYDPEFPENHGLETDETEILYVGALKEHKGVQDLIEQIPDLPEKYHLRIVGDGPKMKKLKQRALDLAAEHKIEFEGYIDHENVARCYERAGWFVHPSRWPEPLNRTLFEAMQNDTAALCSSMGGARYVLHKEQIFGHKSQIPEKIKNLEREKIVKKQNSKLKEYSPKTIVERIEEVYK